MPWISMNKRCVIIKTACRDGSCGLGDNMKKLLAVVGLVCAFPVLAEAPAVLEQLEPEVRIYKQQNAIVREYRMNGQLYMVKIEPSHGYPYYLIDMDGDGLLESRRNQISPNMVVPNWVIYRW
jgi:hypothetical protein